MFNPSHLSGYMLYIKPQLPWLYTAVKCPLEDPEIVVHVAIKSSALVCTNEKS